MLATTTTPAAEKQIYTSVLVTDGEHVGEIWAIDDSPYMCVSGQCAYVVGENLDGSTFADWICLEDLVYIGSSEAIVAEAAIA